MPMNPQLAALYGTAPEAQDDVEKLAAAKLAEELAGDEAVETAEMTDEQIEELASQVLASEQDEEEEVKEPGEEPAAAVTEPEKTSAAKEEEPELSKEAQEKLAEADYLGRVMAHAYVNELREIEKQAAAKPPKAGKVAGFLKGNKKEKKAEAEQPSALDVLAERRALEILNENGIELEQPQVEETETAEKTSASEEQMASLANAVEQRAFELLKANGFIQEEQPEEEQE